MLGRIRKPEKVKAGVADKSAEHRNTVFLSRSTDSAKTTIIGERIAIDGSIHGGEDLEIAGSMRGSVDLVQHDFKVAPGGRMEGDVKARNVTVSGEFRGNIASEEKVTITRGADFYGEIKAKSVSIEDGAYIKAMIELDREPSRKPAATPKSDAPSAPGTDKAPRATPPDGKRES